MIRDLTIFTPPLPLGGGCGEGGRGKVYRLIGDELNTLIEQLNETLAA